MLTAAELYSTEKEFGQLASRFLLMRKHPQLNLLQPTLSGRSVSCTHQTARGSIPLSHYYKNVTSTGAAVRHVHCVTPHSRWGLAVNIKYRWVGLHWWVKETPGMSRQVQEDSSVIVFCIHVYTPRMESERCGGGGGGPAFLDWWGFLTSASYSAALTLAIGFVAPPRKACHSCIRFPSSLCFPVTMWSCWI